MEESWEMWLSEPQKKTYLEVKGILEQQNKKVLEPGDLEHFFNWLFKRFSYISQDLLFDIEPPGTCHGCFWDEIWDKVRDQTEHGLTIEALHASLIISEALEEHLYGPITPKAEDHTNPVAKSTQPPSLWHMTAAVPVEVPALMRPAPSGARALSWTPSLPRGPRPRGRE